MGKVLRLRVEHDWVPPRSEDYKVFGHYLSDSKNKVNVASNVNKDGDTMKSNDVKNGSNNIGSGYGNEDEGWTAVGNWRNMGVGNNVHQGNFGGYHVRRGVFVNRSSGNTTNMLEVVV